MAGRKAAEAPTTTCERCKAEVVTKDRPRAWGDHQAVCRGPAVVTVDCRYCGWSGAPASYPVHWSICRAWPPYRAAQL